MIRVFAKILKSLMPMLDGLIARVSEFVAAELKQVDCSHDWNHISRVRQNAMNFLAKEQAEGRFSNADRLVVEVAALMHDVGDFKYTKDHSAGPRMVRDFLKSFEGSLISAEQIEKIALIVGNISFRHELSHGVAADLPEELKIVQDADRLDAIGAVGVARCFAFIGARGTPFYRETDVLRAMTSDDYNKQTETGEGSAIFHFYEKLFKLKNMMKTESGRREAQERHDFMVQFIRQIEKESEIYGYPIPE
jgi:uncharacterized protein